MPEGITIKRTWLERCNMLNEENYDPSEERTERGAEWNSDEERTEVAIDELLIRRSHEKAGAIAHAVSTACMAVVMVALSLTADPDRGNELCHQPRNQLMR